MYLGIDVGGTKTLLAVFSAEGQIVDEQRLPTAKNYPTFIKQLDKLIKTELADHRIAAACAAVAGFEIDRQAGIVPHLGNLPWRDVHMKKDLQSVLNQVPVFVENDAKLAGLSEALLVKDTYQNVLYLTLGTGVGVAHIVNGEIDETLSDKGGRGLVLEHLGQLVEWDDMASGRALKQRTGKLASALDDPKAWADYAANVAKGLIHFINITKPDVVVVGGGVGAHFDKFKASLYEELLKLNDEGGALPPLAKAQRPEEAVIYGCYDYIHQKTRK